MVMFLVIILVVFFVIPLVKLWLRVRGVRNDLNDLFNRSERQKFYANSRTRAWKAGKGAAKGNNATKGKNRWRKKKAKGDYVEFEEIAEPLAPPEAPTGSTRAESMVSDVEFEEIIDPEK